MLIQYTNGTLQLVYADGTRNSYFAKVLGLTRFFCDIDSNGTNVFAVGSLMPDSHGIEFFSHFTLLNFYSLASL